MFCLKVFKGTRLSRCPVAKVLVLYKLMIVVVFFYISPGVFHSIYWGLGGILGLLIGSSLISVAGPTIAFRLFTMLAVLFIILFTMGLRYVNFRDRNYYSVLLNTFNICVDARNTGQNIPASESTCANNTPQDNNSNGTRTPSVFLILGQPRG